jgi:ATP-dependent Clp protease ATP-binding subunit ClpC
VGHDEGGQLTEKVRRRPYCVVLFDELEKAHEEVWNLLLQILEDGVLTDAQGRRVDFRNAVVVMTTNAGARRQGAVSQPVGFASGQSGQTLRDQAVLAELRRVFRPEFLNRVDDIVVFHPLSQGEMEQVAGQLAEQIAGRMAGLGVALQMEPDALAQVARQASDPDYGARPMRRYLAAQLEDRAAELLLRGALSPGAALRVSAGPDSLALKVLAAAKPELI